VKTTFAVFRISVLLVSLAAVLSCATQPPSTEYSRENRRIGLVEFPYRSTLCHSDVSWTAFQSAKEQYPLPVDLEQVAFSALKRVSAENGHVAIFVDDARITVPVTELFQFSSWGGAPSPVAGTADLLQEVATDNELDVLLFNGAIPAAESEELCLVQYYTDSRKKTGLVYSKQYIYAFDPKTSAYLGTNNGTGGVPLSELFPNNVKSLSPEDLDILIAPIEQGVEDGFRDLFNELGLGEVDFNEKNYVL